MVFKYYSFNTLSNITVLIHSYSNKGEQQYTQRSSVSSVPTPGMEENIVSQEKVDHALSGQKGS